MAFFTLLLIYAAVFLLSELFKPKPDTENAKPSGLGDFNFPTATEGRAVPLLWGTIEITAPNIIWYGDLRTDRIREKIKRGLFSSKSITIGYQYFVGIQFGLCRGPMDGPHDGLMRIRVDDEQIYDTFTTSPQSALGSGNILVDEPEFFGEDAGGIVGNFGVFPGTETQARSTYLESVVTQSPDILPAYRGTFYVIAEQIYIGDAPRLRPFKFTVRRIPDGLSLGTDALVNDLDANLMNVLFEVLTNADWGLAISVSAIDTAGLVTHGATLAAEGNGFSALLDTPRKTDLIIREIENQADGILIRDTSTGQYSFRLIRESNIPSPKSSLPSMDSANTQSVDFSRATWSETTNEVRLDYPDPEKDYAKSFALAQDMANTNIQQANVSVTERYMGVKNAALANQLAWRDIRTLAVPLAKATIVVNREFYTLKPGDPFLLTWPALGITDFLMRVNRLNFGEILNNKITVDAVEDIFTEQDASFGDPIDSGWVPLQQTVTALSQIDQLIFETPRNMNLQDPDNPLQIPRITTVARLSGGAGDEYVTLTREGFSKSLMGAATYIENVGATPNFVVAGELRVTLDATGDAGVFPLLGGATVEVNQFPGDTLLPLVDDAARTDSEINNLITMVYVTDGSAPGSPDFDRDKGEFILYTQALSSSGGSPLVQGVTLSDCYRGALDSRVQRWPAGAKVWFLGFGGIGISSEVFSNEFWVDAKILPSTQDSGALPEASADSTNAIQIDDGFRVNLPLAPNELIINAIRYQDSLTISVNSSAISYDYTRLNWRTVGGVNTIEGLNTDGSTFDPAGQNVGDGLSYIWQLYDEGSPNIGSPNVISRGETAVDDASNDGFSIPVNDIYGVVADPNGGRLRIEIQGFHRTTSPGLASREKLIHSFDWTGASVAFGGPYDFGTFLGRIPYGAVVSPGVVVVPQGSPGSPHAITLLQVRLAQGAIIDDGPGTGENGKLYILTNDASPATLLFNAQTSSPATQTLFSSIAGPGSPQNWVDSTVNMLHYHNTGRPIFFQIEDQANSRVVAWGILEPQTNTVPD